MSLPRPAPSLPIADRCRRLVEALGLAAPDDVRNVRPLAGGVSSDIAVVSLPDREICVKFACDRLRVAEIWYAPLGRNLTEYRWLDFASRAAPGHVPRLLGQDQALGGLAMEYLAGDDVVLWKNELLAGRVDPHAGAAVGGALGRIHAASTRAGFDPTRFANHDDFHVLRLEPYFLFTAGRHPDLGGRLSDLAETLYRASIALIHGDVSPKNILFAGDRPIFLDAECATMGDPAFDLAFCLNHLILKAVHLPPQRDALLHAARDLLRAHAATVDWEPPAALEQRTARLLPALMLGRIDGKSPVEYLSDANRPRVRTIARDLLTRPVGTLGEILSVIERLG